ncbi:MAG: DUF4266 domain-containing protein [Bacteroidetes bacterium]|nr:DUF4266 domain-containing protein [Bacteroidota bacterium]MBL0097020.1 DUF4266 domain-containing protein [Bacteroidota bacterium]
MKTKRFTPIFPRKFHLFLLGLGVLLLAQGCQAVKPYQRAYLNDRAMEINGKPIRAFEDYFESIREGATFPGGEKTSGGCGCN